MKISRGQRRAAMQLFTASNWPQRLGAIAVLIIAAFTWWQHGDFSPLPECNAALIASTLHPH